MGVKLTLIIYIKNIFFMLLNIFFFSGIDCNFVLHYEYLLEIMCIVKR